MGAGRLYLTKRLVRGRAFGALLAVAFAVCAAPLPALFDLSPAVGASIDREVASMGPAVSVVARPASLAAPGGSPGAGGLLPENLTQAILDLPEARAVAEALPMLEGVVALGPRSIPLVGLDASKVAGVLPWWSTQGATAWSNGSQAWVGRSLADGAALAPGATVLLQGPGASANFTVAALLETGGAEDGAAVVPLAAAQALLGQAGKVTAILLRVGDFDALPAVARAIEAAFPFLEARTVLQLVQGRQALLTTFRVLSAAVALTTAAAAALTAVSAGAVSLRARVQELAVLRALGASRGDITRYLGAEVAVLGAVGTAAGLAVGFALSAALGPWLFAVPVAPSPSTAFVAAAAAAGVGLLVLHGVARAASRGDLAEVLKDG